jgi:putative transposase
MRRKSYPSDLTNWQWNRLKGLLPAAKPGGRPRSVDLREVVNGILYRAGWLRLADDAPRPAPLEHLLRLLPQVAQ